MASKAAMSGIGTRADNPSAGGVRKIAERLGGPPGVIAYPRRGTGPRWAPRDQATSPRGSGHAAAGYHGRLLGLRSAINRSAETPRSASSPAPSHALSRQP